jgi:hypothetical protein
LEREWDEKSYGSVDNISQQYLVEDKAPSTAFSFGNKHSTRRHHH